MPQDHKEPARKATAALIELLARGRAMEAAILRGDSPEDILRMRGEAHDVLDAYLDLTTQAAHAARSILEP